CYYNIIDDLYNLYLKDIIPQVLNGICDDILVNVALYYLLKNNILQAKKYYLMAIDNGNIIAMRNYAYIMKNENKEEAIKYYKMAIAKENYAAMNNYACLLYYNNKRKAIKYYKMAIDKEHINDITNNMINDYVFVMQNEDKEESMIYLIM